MQHAVQTPLFRAKPVILKSKPSFVARVFIVDTVFGRTVKEYEGDINSARRQALREFGSRGYSGIQRATLDKLVDIKRAGGWMPVSVRPQVEQHDKELRAARH